MPCLEVCFVRRLISLGFFRQMRLDLYSTYGDYIRAVLEFAFCILLMMSVREEYRDIKVRHVLAQSYLSLSLKA